MFDQISGYDCQPSWHIKLTITNRKEENDTLIGSKNKKKVVLPKFQRGERLDDFMC